MTIFLNMDYCCHNPTSADFKIFYAAVWVVNYFLTYDSLFTQSKHCDLLYFPGRYSDELHSKLRPSEIEPPPPRTQDRLFHIPFVFHLGNERENYRPRKKKDFVFCTWSTEGKIKNMFIIIKKYNNLGTSPKRKWGKNCLD